MKRAVAAAFVLIMGAAVVLWYGNTLNSWVLGGLIGGLAALLLSIPISLTLFSYLARRQDHYSPPNEYYEYYVDETYTDDVSYEYEQRYLDPRQQLPTRGFAQEHRLIEQERVSRRDHWPEEDEYDPPSSRTKQLPSPRRASQPTKDVSSQRPANRSGAKSTRPLASRGKTTRNLTRRLPTSGFPGYQVDQTHSQFRSQALRAARREAARQYDDPSVEEYPTQQSSRRPSRHSSNAYPSQGTSGDDEYYSDEYAQPEPPRRQYGSKNPRRSRQVIDAESHRVLPEPAPQRPSYQDPETENIDPEFSTGTLKKPLQRRAPYTYDDDPIRKQFSQQIDPAPRTRRQSRYLFSDEVDE